jgi:hypothetical protein
MFTSTMDLVLAPDDHRSLEQMLRQTTLSQAIAKRVRISTKSITHFGPKRSPVSVHGDQPFRLMSITGRRTRTRG